MPTSALSLRLSARSYGRTGQRKTCGHRDARTGLPACMAVPKCGGNQARLHLFKQCCANGHGQTAPQAGAALPPPPPTSKHTHARTRKYQLTMVSHTDGTNRLSVKVPLQPFRKKGWKRR